MIASKISAKMNVGIKVTHKNEEKSIIWKLLELGLGKVDEQEVLGPCNLSNGCLYSSLEFADIEFVQPISQGPYSVNDSNELQNLFGHERFLESEKMTECKFNQDGEKLYFIKIQMKDNFQY